MILPDAIRLGFIDSIIIGVYVLCVWTSIEYFVNWIKKKLNK
jgi:hypothetical protein